MMKALRGKRAGRILELSQPPFRIVSFSATKTCSQVAWPGQSAENRPRIPAAIQYLGTNNHRVVHTPDKQAPVA